MRAPLFHLKVILLAALLALTGATSVRAQYDDSPAAFWNQERARQQARTALKQKPTHLIRRAAPVRRVSNSQAVRVRGARCSTQDVYCCDSDSSSGSSYGNYRRRRARRFSNRCCDTRVQRSWPFWPGTCAPLPPAYIVPNACSPICLPGGPIFPCDVTAAVVTETMCRLP